MTKVIVFDYDDTLSKSEYIKQEAPIGIFSVVPGAREIVREYRAAHRNTPRRELIAEILAVLEERGVRVTIEKPLEYFLNEFNRLAEEAQITGPLIPGAEEALRLFSLTSSLYINTATPQEYIKRVIPARGWSSFFKGIYGCSHPSAKIDNLREIIAREGVFSHEVVVVGDGKSDLESATTCGCYFIGIRGEYYDFGNDVSFPVLDDLRLLRAAIDSFV